MKVPCAAASALEHLTEVSRYVSEIANLAHNERAPYVGDNAFAHKGGIHVSALKKDTSTYEHLTRRSSATAERCLCRNSRQGNIEFKARELGIELKEGVTLRHGY